MKKNIDERNIFLKGENIFLKVLNKEDVLSSSWYGWFNDEKLCETLQKHYYPNSIENQLEYLNFLNNSKEIIQLGICKNDSEKIIGVISLSNINYLSRKAELSIVIGESDERSPKIFIESCNLIFKHAFLTLNLNRIYGGSFSQNVIELLCRTLGCNKEGIAKEDVFKNGKYNDVYKYAILKKDFKI